MKCPKCDENTTLGISECPHCGWSFDLDNTWNEDDFVREDIDSLNEKLG